jgi:phosphoadenosine phosphosulfate reductase
MHGDAHEFNTALENATTHDILKWCYAHFDAQRIKLSTSFGAEGMVLLHMLVALIRKPRVFFIDTGRNFQETYDVWQRVTDTYDLDIEVFPPDPDDLADLAKHGGPNLFFLDVEHRKQCCHVRKVKPLLRALADTDAWIAPLRRGQSDARSKIDIVSFSTQHNVYKICPLAKWSEDDVWEYIRNNNVPYNALYDKGYPTIGCAPCCRPLRPAEKNRASRWWWEQDAQKECGIHIEDGKIVRTAKPPTWSI